MILGTPVFAKWINFQKSPNGPVFRFFFAIFANICVTFRHLLKRKICNTIFSGRGSPPLPFGLFPVIVHFGEYSRPFKGGHVNDEKADGQTESNEPK